jgi:hypothetical protein
LANSHLEDIRGSGQQPYSNIYWELSGGNGCGDFALRSHSGKARGHSSRVANQTQDIALTRLVGTRLDCECALLPEEIAEPWMGDHKTERADE